MNRVLSSPSYSCSRLDSDEFAHKTKASLVDIYFSRHHESTPQYMSLTINYCAIFGSVGLVGFFFGIPPLRLDSLLHYGIVFNC